MKMLSVRVEDELLLATKRRALDTGVSLTEVVSRLLAAYVDGKVRVNGALVEGDHGERPEIGQKLASTGTGEAHRETQPDTAPSASALNSLLASGALKKGSEVRPVPDGVDPETGEIIRDFHAEPFEETP